VSTLSKLGIALVLFALISSSVLIAMESSPTAATGAPRQSAPVHVLSGLGISLLPTHGAVGTTVAVTGSGFPSSSTVDLSFAGRAVVSNCSTDASGSFPGSSATPCTFVVPTFAPGTANVTASVGPETVAIGVGGLPEGIAYVPTLGEAFVANWNTNNVSVVSITNDTVLASIGVGSGPTGVAYDPVNGQIFVTNSQSANVSVIATRNLSVVATIALATGISPDGIAYDSGTRQMFVAEPNIGNVTVISGATHAIIANITGGSVTICSPNQVAYDPGTSQVFVSDDCSHEVTVIDDSNDSVAATVTVTPGSEAFGLAYDNLSATVWEVNSGYNNVSEISDVTDALGTTINVGSGPYDIAFDWAADEMFVANDLSNNVSVIDASSGTVATSLPAGNGPYGLAYDAGANEVLVTNSGANSLSAIPLVPGVSASASFIVPQSPRLSLSPTSGTSGSSVAASGVGFAPNATISLTFDGTGVTSTCASGSSGSFPGPTGTPCTFTVPSLPTGAYNVSASDGTNASNASFSIVAGLSLTPSSGFVGSTVAAAGSGFAANSSISFTYNAGAVASTCRSDAQGAFPGTTGSACTFTVPVGPGGPNAVTATDGIRVSSSTFTVESRLTLSPAAGGVGSVIDASGTGFAPDVPVTFNLGGIGVPSDCSTDGTGSFPGASGTPCTIVPPPSPSGNKTIVASTSGLSAVGNTSVGSLGAYPEAVAADPANGEEYVADDGTNLVEVIAVSNYSVITTILVGTGPDAIAYDSGRGEIFVANSGSNNVSVIATSNNTVVASVGVGSDPDGIAYDSGRGEVFVGNGFGHNVTVISDATNQVVSNITLTSGAGVEELAYDSGTGQIFVVNSGLNSVGVIDDSNNSVVGYVGVGSNPDGIAYDSTYGELFVTNQITDNVSVVSDVNDSVVATVPVGLYPYTGIAYDPQAGDVFVGNFGSNNISVIADSDNAVTATLTPGNGPAGISYDPAAEDVYVANENSNNVTIFSVPSSSASANFTVRPTLTLVPTADEGQNLTLLAQGFGGSTDVTTFTIGTASVACTQATVGTCTAGSAQTAANGSLRVQFLVPLLSNSGAYTVTLADGAGNTATISLTVSPALVVTTPTGNAVDVGQHASIMVTASSGSGGYGYNWSGLPSGCAGVTATISCAPTTSGNYTITVRITDSNGASLTSGALTFRVFKDPVASRPTGVPGSGLVDSDQTATFEVSADLGTGNYTAYAWSGLPQGCLGSTVIVVCSGSELPAGQYSISATVTDTNGQTSLASPLLAFTVDPIPTVSVPTASHSSVDLNQSVSFTASSPGGLGSGSPTYSWTGLPTGCSSSPSASITCTPSAPGAIQVQVQVTDSNNGSVTSPALAFTVYRDPTAVLNASRTGFDAGQSVSLTAGGQPGSGTDAYAWSGLPVGCSGTTATINCTVGARGDYVVTVLVTDSNGESNRSTPVDLTVADRVSAAIGILTVAPTVGESVNFTSNATGGTGTLTVSWQFGDGSVGTGSTAEHSYARAGTYNVTLWVNDTVGGSVEKTAQVTVTQPGSTTVASSPSSDLPLLVGILVVVVVAAVLGVWLMRRGRAPPARPDEGATPAAEEETQGPTTTDEEDQ
jgi:YVTN family beta-propeller protein